MELTKEQLAFREEVRKLAQGPIKDRAAEVDRTEQYPWDNVALLREAGYLGMTLPREYGGRGASWLAAVLLIEELSQACAVTGRIAVETNMGAISAIMAYGTDEQKKLAADMVLGGDKPAICITEPAAGSSAGDMTTRADRRGNHYAINGSKHWITGGGVSRLHLIFARVFDQQGREEGIGGFLAIRDETPGLRIVKREPTMGLRGIPEAELVFEEMEVPSSALLVTPRGLMKSFADLMAAYNSQRVGAATVALGLAQVFSNVWSTGGSGREDVSLFTWQFFANYNMANGWYLTSSPIITANWEAKSGSDTWTVPVGGGVGKILRIGSLPPMNFQVQGFYNVAKPGALGRLNLRVQLQLLFPKSR